MTNKLTLPLEQLKQHQCGESSDGKGCQNQQSSEENFNRQKHARSLTQQNPERQHRKNGKTTGGDINLLPNGVLGLCGD